ncbi:hypothetical protein EJB05_18369 [Eragrostis curvula]|uniref:Uncharacterized protein n=1 Tax=Eragrostis curvula TaxID=38414 RepID=A0A5J9VLN1_9POAL|nr:hypothetical protein EJB05_18369 [Eragrostis curvula]
MVRDLRSGLALRHAMRNRPGIGQSHAREDDLPTLLHAKASKLVLAKKKFLTLPSGNGVP